MIDMRNVSKIYQLGSEEVRALDDVTLTIEEHEFTAVIGPSGSGKSTMMNILGCLDTIDSGEYYLDGVNVSDMTDDQLAGIRNRKIGFIFQQFNLLQKLNAFENVELPLIYQGVPRVERQERAREALAQVGLSDRLNHRPNQLSGGQQQRVAIARALATRPELILADEPTGNLDSRSSLEIIGLLHELHQQGNTIVVITHDPDIADEAQRLIHLKDGRIVEDHRKAPKEVRT
jgi:putative ABC transport system ATP-binding protein